MDVDFPVCLQELLFEKKRNDHDRRVGTQDR